MGAVELCWVLDCRLVQYCEFPVACFVCSYMLTAPFPEYLDDFVLLDCGWSDVVAVMAVCVGGLFPGRSVRVCIGAHRSCLPYLIPRRGAGVIRYLGVDVAGV